MTNKFLDLKNYDIVERSNYYRQLIVLDGERLLSSPVKKAIQYIENQLGLGYVDKTVLYECVFNNTSEFTDIDFEDAVDLVVGCILKRNQKEGKADEVRLGLPDKILQNVSCKLLPLKTAFDHQADNNFFNITCHTLDKKYIYTLVK